MAEELIARPRSVPPARRKGFAVFCAVLAVVIGTLVVKPFEASAGHRADDGRHPGSGSHGPGRAQTSQPVTDPSGPSASVPSSGGDVASLQRLIDAGEPIFCGGGTQPLVALTFDDGPGVNTQETIDLLKSRGMTATFFTVGKLYDAAPGWPDLLKQEARFGAVGDHTWDHIPVNDMSASQLDDQILRTRHDAERLSGHPVFLFRPPLGLRSDTLDAYLPEHGMLDIMWSIDSEDSQGAKADQIYQTIKDHLTPGDIILLHEGRGTTQLALPRILDLIEQRGYTAVTVPQLLEMDPPSREQLRQHSCAV
jgi:peptidoglycan/xylan/chitin deacetylase (PgdA/CDA1 family)